MNATQTKKKRMAKSLAIPLNCMDQIQTYHIETHAKTASVHCYRSYSCLCIACWLKVSHSEKWTKKKKPTTTSIIMSMTMMTVEMAMAMQTTSLR